MRQNVSVVARYCGPVVCGNPIPSVLTCEASVHGYRFMVTGGMPEPSSGNDLAIGVHRVPATLVFAVSCFMWALTALALIMVVGDIRSSGPIDGSIIALLGVPLFAFPAVRNSVRNAPGLGVLGDYLSYFWC